jgi:hypothetical protein
MIRRMPERLTYFYLYETGTDIELRELTDLEASDLRDAGRMFLDIGQKSLEDAGELRRQYLLRRADS